MDDLSQSTLVWSLVSHKDHVWAPCFSLSMHPSYSGWLRINSHKPISNTSQKDAVRVIEWCIENIRWWLIHDRLLDYDKTIRLKLLLLELASNLTNCRLWILNLAVKSRTLEAGLTEIWICVTILQMYVRRVFSTCIILDALRSTYRETAYLPWYTHSSQAR